MDSSNIRLGPVLSLVHNGKEQATAYYKNGFLKQRGVITRINLLVIVRGFENLLKYLYGMEVLLRTCLLYTSRCV